MDFDYPLGKVWYGFLIDHISFCKGTENSQMCELCKKMAKIMDIPFSEYGCPDFDKYTDIAMSFLRHLMEPPEGSGYQLWETTTEGSPLSPVFRTLEELCDWCESNATAYAGAHLSKDEWFELLREFKS